jgi:hypothetical protein
MSKVDIKQFVIEVAKNFNENYAIDGFKFDLDEHGLACFFDEILPLMDDYLEINDSHEDKYFEMLFKYANTHYCLTGSYSIYEGREYDIWCALEKGEVTEKTTTTYIFKGD